MAELAIIGPHLLVLGVTMAVVAGMLLYKSTRASIIGGIAIWLAAMAVVIFAARSLLMGVS